MLKIKASRAYIEHTPMYNEMTVVIDGQADDILKAVLKEFHPMEILEAMTKQQQQEMTDTLFERFAVGDPA